MKTRRRGRLAGRGQRRVAAEAAWGLLAEALDLPMHYFRLAGIYGPGRNQLASLKAGTARRIDKPGQVFSRIHVEDIATILLASMESPQAGRAYSVCDDEPAPPQDVVAFAAALMGLEPPPLIAFEDADLSPMAKSFYGENKRLKNSRIKQELGVTLKYPSYREGLRALFEAQRFLSREGVNQFNQAVDFMRRGQAMVAAFHKMQFDILVRSAVRPIPKIIATARHHLVGRARFAPADLSLSAPQA